MLGAMRASGWGARARLALLAVLACAAAPARAAGGRPREVPLSLRGPTHKFGGGEMFVPCAFDGAAQTCRLDTGAGRKIIVAAQAPFLKYPRVSTGSDLDAVGARSAADFIRIGALRLGTVDVGPARARRVKGARPRRPLIGPQAVAKAFALLFGARPRLVLDAKAPPGPLEPLLPFDYDRHLFLRVQLGSKEQTALLDTGCPLTEVDSAFAAAHPKEFSFHGEFIRTPGQPDAKLYKLTELTVGGRRFRNVDVKAFDFALYRKKAGKPDLSVMLGYDLITRAGWYFDLAGRRWGLYPAKHGQKPARGLH